MSVLDYIINAVTSGFWVIAALVVVAAIVFFALGGKLARGGVKIINRAEVIRKKMIKILGKNRSKLRVLMQKDNIIGLTWNVGSYVNESGKTVYFVLYMPKLISVIPAIWDKSVLIVSEDFIEKEESGKMILKKDYFIDDYFGIKIDYADKNALGALELKIDEDESENTSSIHLAQSLRLSTLDITKPFEVPEKPEEKPKEEVKK